MKEAIKNIEILSGCISCGMCEVICSDVFVVNPTATVKADADLQKNLECIVDAAKMCPVEVIKVTLNEGDVD